MEADHCNTIRFDSYQFRDQYSLAAAQIDDNFVPLRGQFQKTANDLIDCSHSQPLYVKDVVSTGSGLEKGDSIGRQ